MTGAIAEVPVVGILGFVIMLVSATIGLTVLRGQRGVTGEQKPPAPPAPRVAAATPSSRVAAPAVRIGQRSSLAQARLLHGAHGRALAPAPPRGQRFSDCASAAPVRRVSGATGHRRLRSSAGARATGPTELEGPPARTRARIAAGHDGRAGRIGAGRESAPQTSDVVDDPAVPGLVLAGRRGRDRTAARDQQGLGQPLGPAAGAGRHAADQRLDHGLGVGLGGWRPGSQPGRGVPLVLERRHDPRQRGLGLGRDVSTVTRSQHAVLARWAAEVVHEVETRSLQW